MPSIIIPLRTIIALCLTLYFPVSACRAVEGNAATLDQLTADEKWDDSIDLARAIAETPNREQDLTLSFARLARGLQNAGQLKTAAEFYQRAVDESERPPAEKLSGKEKTLVRLAASDVLVQSQQLSAAISALEPILKADSTATDSQKQLAVWVLLRGGSTGLSHGSFPVAGEAYALALQHADEQQRPIALLGDAWATAVQSEQSADAVRKLANFVEQYPKHQDAPNAARGCAQCLKQMGRDADSTAMLSDLLARWPDSTAAVEVIRSHCGLATALIPSAVRHWLLSKAKADDLKTFDAKTTMLGLLIASELSELVAWSNLAQHLAITDQTGQTTSDTLSQLQLQEKASDAEQLAIQFIAPDAEHPVTTAAREAACRWAGRTSRWSMLAIASESQDLTAADPTRTLAVERLFAESLTQTGRTKDAHQWWVYLADVRSAKDFGTLIRCAETETAFGKSTSKAGERIAAARQAAGEENSSLRLVSMLESEVAIRRSDFDQARSLLEQVVRSTDAAGGLRGRAQWLIGETWYMQRKFTKAIDSYRKVEQIDTSGRWVAASFLQAGKSFEQMGRTKEATLCYGTLLSRFADTEYAVPAQRRLAAMSPGNNPTNPSTTQPTIRR